MHWRGRFRGGLRTAVRSALGRAHWRGCSGGGVRTARGDQCANPRANMVRSAHSWRQRKTERTNSRLKQVHSVHTWALRTGMDASERMRSVGSRCRYRSRKARGPVCRRLLPSTKSTNAKLGSGAKRVLLHFAWVCCCREAPNRANTPALTQGSDTTHVNAGGRGVRSNLRDGSGPDPHGAGSRIGVPATSVKKTTFGCHNLQEVGRFWALLWEGLKKRGALPAQTGMRCRRMWEKETTFFLTS